MGKIEHEEAFLIYHYNFRGYKEIFFVVAIVAIFLILLLLLFRWLTKHFREINLGIDNLLAEDEKKIRLSPEMLPFDLPKGSRIELTNNLADQAVKPFVIGRKTGCFSTRPTEPKQVPSFIP